jgi:hypothetical protein
LLQRLLDPEDQVDQIASDYWSEVAKESTQRFCLARFLDAATIDDDLMDGFLNRLLRFTILLPKSCSSDLVELIRYLFLQSFQGR